MKQKLVFGVLVLSLAIALAACGSSASNSSNSSGGAASGGNSGDPAAAAKGFYDAMYGTGQIDQFVCGSNKAGIDALKQSITASKTALTAANATIDVSGLKYEAANQSGDFADVKISGKIKTTVGGNATEMDFPAMTLKMKNESGWKVCGMSA